MNVSVDSAVADDVGSLFGMKYCQPDDGSFYYKMEPYLAMFYLVHPARTMCPSIEGTPNFFNMVARIAPVTFVIEYILMWLQGLQTYKWSDSLTGFGVLTIITMPQALLETLAFTTYTWIYANYRIIDLSYNSLITWILCALVVDLMLYIVHRTMHEVNVLWAFHQTHHSSEYFTLFSASRNTFTDKSCVLISLAPWALIFPPGPLKMHHNLNFAFQLWIHTPVIGNLGPLEYIFNTPTQHAIHHGRNRFCIDTNYAGFLSIWDQLFGTMVWPKDTRDKTISFGLVKPTASWDVVYIYCAHLRDIFKRAAKYDKLSDKISTFLKGPGWEPGKPRLGLMEDIPEVPDDPDPYDKQSSASVYLYCFINIVIVFIVSNIAVSRHMHMSSSAYEQTLTYAYVVWTIADIGYLLEHKWYVPALEWTRCAMFFVVEWMLSAVFAPFGATALIAMKIFYGLSVVFWAFNLGYYPKELDLKTD